jgi:hypothetical protein
VRPLFYSANLQQRECICKVPPRPSACSRHTALSMPMCTVRSTAQSARSHSTSRLRVAPPPTSHLPRRTSTVAAARSSSTGGGEWHSCIERPLLVTHVAASSRTKLLAAALRWADGSLGRKADGDLARAGRWLPQASERADGDLG